MKDKLEKIRDNAHYAYRQLGVWQSSSAEDTKAIQKLKECVTLADSILAELDSEGLEAILKKIIFKEMVGCVMPEHVDLCEEYSLDAAKAAINAIKGTK